MDYEKLTALIEQIDESSLAYLNYETEFEHVILSKEVPQISANQEALQSVNQTPEAVAEAVAKAPADEEPAEKAGEVVESPMVGIVYLQAGPDKDPYVKVGDRVEQGDTVCIIEAMKLMNEIQAPKSGIVTEIMVENEEVVEYNQPLIRID